MNFSKFSIFASIILVSSLAVANAKSVDSGAKIESSNETDSPSMSKDAGGASSEGASSDFDIQQLLKMIEALKDQNFDGFEEILNDSKGHIPKDDSAEFKTEEAQESKSEGIKEENVESDELKADL